MLQGFKLELGLTKHRIHRLDAILKILALHQQLLGQGTCRSWEFSAISGSFAVLILIAPGRHIAAGRGRHSAAAVTLDSEGNQISVVEERKEPVVKHTPRSKTNNGASATGTFCKHTDPIWALFFLTTILCHGSENCFHGAIASRS